jgi:hypothetical protein
MKELVFKKMTELEEIYKNAHVDIDSDSEHRVLSDLIDSGSLLSFISLILFCFFFFHNKIVTGLDVTYGH